MQIREPWPSARTRQRRREFAAVFDRVPAGGLGDGLEIGGGDGFLASLLAPYCRSFVTTDSYRPRLAAGPGAGAPPRRTICDATSLPFAGAAFDFIFSSSVLEHIRDRRAAFGEMRRCLRPHGFMIHIMPSRTWKLLQMLLYYPHLLLGALDLVLARVSGGARDALPAAVGERWSDRRNWRLSLRTIARGAVPRVHGEYDGHRSEWRGFGAEAWAAELQEAGFTVQRVLLLPLYSGYGFGLEALRRLGERFRLSSHNAFLVTSQPGSLPALSWFDGAPTARLAAPAPRE